MIEDEWLKTAQIRRNVHLDVHTVMPNHLHGIVWMATDGGSVAHAPVRRGLRSPSHTIGSIVRGFKSASTSRAVKALGTATPIWQRNYYEHVVRSEDALAKIRDYVVNNPALWTEDRYFTAKM